MEDFADSIARVISVQEGEEDAQAYTIERENITVEQTQEFVDALEELSNHLETGRVSIVIEGDNDEYSLQYNPSSNIVVSSQTEGDDYELDNLYPNNDVLVGHLEELKLDTISTIEGAFEVLDTISDHSEYFDISVSYNLRKSNVEDAIFQKASIEVNPHVSFSIDYLREDLNSSPPEEFRPEFLGDHQRCILVIIGADIGEYSSTIGVTSLKATERILSKMGEKEPDREEKVNEVATTALIENIGTYLPPDTFHLTPLNEGGTKLDAVFYRHRVIFSALAISSNARHIGNGEWKIIIQGKQFIEGTISFPDSTHLQIDKSDDIALTDSAVAEIESLYTWIYDDGQAQNRIDILRNVTTLYARSLKEVLEDADTILSSANSNLQYYRRESVDDFVNFRQEMIEGAIQTQRQFSELRSELMSGLSRDLFRTFGFIIVVAAGLFIRGDEFLGTNVLLGLSSVLVIGYTAITWRRVNGIKKQFTKQTENHGNLEDFYGRFFDRSELEKFGVRMAEKEQLVIDCLILRSQGNDEMTNRFRHDLALYYLLLGMMLVIGVGLMGSMFFVGAPPSMPSIAETQVAAMI